MTDQTLWFDQALLPAGWADRVRVTVRDGLIAAVETGVARVSGEAGGGIALPGMPNLHSHAFQRGMAGLTEGRGPSDDDFWTWRELMYRFLDRGGPDEIEAITAYAFMEMLEGGFTRVAEFHYLHNDVDGRPYADRAEIARRIVAAAGETGIGLTLLPVFYAHSTFGGAAPNHGQRRFINDVAGFADLMALSVEAVKSLPDAVVGVAPHSLRAVTPEELDAVVAMTGGPVHIHVAEQVKEVRDCLDWSGARPVEWLMAHAPVDRRWCLIHSTHVTEAEMTSVAQSGAVVGLCPITEANLGDGIFPAVAYRNAGGRFGVGTDSNVMIGAAEELRTLEYSQRLSLKGRGLMAGETGSTGRGLYEAALDGGAQATGTLATGAPAGIAPGLSADLVMLDAGHVAFHGRRGDAVLDSWIMAARGSPIAGVWRRGERVVTGGVHHGRPAIEARFRQALKAITG